MEIFCNIIKVFTVTFDQFNASLLHKKYYVMTAPKLLNVSVLRIREFHFVTSK